MKEKKGRRYAFWNVRDNSEELLGTLNEETKQICSLPEVGAHVVVFEGVVYGRYSTGSKIVTAYRPSRSFLDAWSYPKVLRIAGYSRGRENALDPHNIILLECEGRSGTIRHTVQARHVAVGAMMLKEVNEGDSIEGESWYKSQYWDYNDLIIRETAAELSDRFRARRRGYVEKTG